MNGSKLIIEMMERNYVEDQICIKQRRHMVDIYLSKFVLRILVQVDQRLTFGQLNGLSTWIQVLAFKICAAARSVVGWGRASNAAVIVQGVQPFWHVHDEALVLERFYPFDETC